MIVNNFIVKNLVVVDKDNNLMWQRYTAGRYSWYEAVKYCHSLNLLGYKNWRLPSKEEFETICDYSKFAPTIDMGAFPDTKALPHWTGDEGFCNFYAVYKNFHKGYVIAEYKYFKNCVRAVRFLEE